MRVGMSTSERYPRNSLEHWKSVEGDGPYFDKSQKNTRLVVGHGNACGHKTHVGTSEQKEIANFTFQIEIEKIDLKALAVGLGKI